MHVINDAGIYSCIEPATGKVLKTVRRGGNTYGSPVVAAGYDKVIDTEIWALAPNTILESNPNASSDANNDGGESQVLLRFDEIFGNWWRVAVAARAGN